jgi:hypothetical protein
LAELGPDAQSAIYRQSSIDLAMRDAFRKMRRFSDEHPRAYRGRGDLADVGRVDFGITQVVDGN